MKRSMMGKSASTGGSAGSGHGMLHHAKRSMMLSDHEIEGWSPARKLVLMILNRPIVEFSIGALALSSFLLAFMEADYVDSEVPEWITIANIATLAVYAIEAAATIFVLRIGFFMSVFNIVDITVISIDMVSLIIDLCFSVDGLPSIAFLRIFRLLKLARGYKVIVGFPQLALMVRCFAFAIPAALYGTFLLFIILTVWSVCAVHFIHPVNMRVALQGAYVDCARCEHAFSSVRNSMITFIQQIIAGDSWGVVTIPIIEEAPWTALIFSLVFVSINFVILNVIMSVIVDSALKASQEDTQDIVRHKALEFSQAEKRLKVLCGEMDHNGSGDLTEDELRLGFETVPEFADQMKAMDVGKDDMHVVFSMLDADGSGSVSYDEFISELFKLKSHDSHTLLMFIKHHVTTMHQMLMTEEKARKDIQARMHGMQKEVEHMAHDSRRGSLVSESGSTRMAEEQDANRLYATPLPQEKDLSSQMCSQAESLKDLGEELRSLRRVISEDLMQSMRDISSKSESHKLLFSSVTDNLLVLPSGDHSGGQPFAYAAAGSPGSHRRFAQCGPHQHPLASVSPQGLPASTWGVRSCCAVQRAEQEGMIPRSAGPAAPRKEAH